MITRPKLLSTPTLLVALLATVSSCSSDVDPESSMAGAPGLAGTVGAAAGNASAAAAGNASGGTSDGGRAGSWSGAGTATAGAASGGATGDTAGGSPGAAGMSAGAGGRAGSGGSSGHGGLNGSGGSSGSGGSRDAGTEGDGPFTVTDFTAPPGVPNAPQGFTTKLTVSGSDLAPGNHAVTVVIPSQYVDGAEAPFMILADGIPGISGNTLVNAVRNRAAATDARRVPPLVLIGVTPGSNRSVEYDTVSDRYFRFITTAVLPAVLSNSAIKAKYPNLKLTSKPEGRGVYGCSSGGSAAMGMAWFGDFTRVMSFSGSFVSLQKTPPLYPDGAWDYPQIIKSSPLRPELRIFLEVGTRDQNRGGTMDWIKANQNMTTALADKGYHYRSVTAVGAVHCDGAAIAAVLPDALTWLWRGYEAN